MFLLTFIPLQLKKTNSLKSGQLYNRLAMMDLLFSSVGQQQPCWESQGWLITHITALLLLCSRAGSGLH